jgi:hypothetical protein
MSSLDSVINLERHENAQNSQYPRKGQPLYANDPEPLWQHELYKLPLLVHVTYKRAQEDGTRRHDGGLRFIS